MVLKILLLFVAIFALVFCIGTVIQIFRELRARRAKAAKPAPDKDETEGGETK